MVRGKILQQEAAEHNSTIKKERLKFSFEIYMWFKVRKYGVLLWREISFHMRELYSLSGSNRVNFIQVDCGTPMKDACSSWRAETCLHIFSALSLRLNEELFPNEGESIQQKPHLVDCGTPMKDACSSWRAEACLRNFCILPLKLNEELFSNEDESIQQKPHSVDSVWNI